MSGYLYIDQQPELDRAMAKLAEYPVVGLDTETSGFFTYFPELCLVQFSAGDFHGIIDTRAGLDLSDLASILANRSIVKIFHAASADIQAIRGAGDYPIYNIFDTHLAARMVGHEGTSLQALVKHYCNVNLAKEEQKSDWRIRPLSESQLDYAHRDTIYLETIREKLLEKLEERNLVEEINGEFELLERIGPPTERPIDSDGWVRIPGSKELSPIQKSLLKRLYLIRESEARLKNIIAFRLVNNAALIQLVRNRPRTMPELKSYTRLNRAFVANRGEEILDALNSKVDASESVVKSGEIPSEESRALLKALKKWRQKIALERKLDISLILSNRVLEKLSVERPATLDELEKLDLMSEWKLQKYHHGLLEVISNKLPLQDQGELGDAT